MAFSTPDTTPNCRSELAREKRPGIAFIQGASVNVKDFREQARSYRGTGKAGKKSPANWRG
jgi:hypothetical protein